VIKLLTFRSTSAVSTSWFYTLGTEEDVLRELRESGLQKKMNNFEKSKLKEIFEQIASSTGGSTLDSSRRKTRKDMPTRNSMKHNYRGPQSASPLYMNRRHDDDSESGDEMGAGMEDFDEEDIHNYDDKGSYDNPHDIIENDLDNDSQSDSAPTAPTCDEGDPGFNNETSDDLKKYDLKDLIYKLFLNIYNSEKDNITKLKKEIFPRINEQTQLDSYITYAISNCMDHVKDELQSYIKKNLKFQRKKTDAPQKSMINDSSFVPLCDNMKKYNEIIDKIIDFYELFKCSIGPIVEVWKEKLGHIERLYEIFDYRHKKLFSVNIWQDREIVDVIKLFLKQNYDDEEYRKRIEELKTIDEDLNENMQYNAKEMNNSNSKKASKKSKKNKNKAKKCKENATKAEKEAEKLYEINDIDLLCSMIESSEINKKDKLQKESKIKKKETKSGSPKQDKNKIDANEKLNQGKENNCMNNGKSDDLVKDKIKVESNDGKTAPATKMKVSEANQSRDSKLSSPDSSNEEGKEIEDLKQFLKNCCKSKRKILIKPNIPIKWINDLKAKLAKIQSK
jgi:hypothetical protein